MTSNPTDLRVLRFDENVRVRGWVIAILGLVLGLTAGGMTGVAIRNLVGDEPIISGLNATIFYLTFTFAVVLDVFVLVNFTNLSVSVSDRGIEFRYGLFSKFLRWDQVESAEPNDYKWSTYGGWGIRVSTQGRRAWSQMGVKGGVTVNVVNSGDVRSYFVSSRRAEDLAAAIQRGIADHNSQAGAPGTTS